MQLSRCRGSSISASDPGQPPPRPPGDPGAADRIPVGFTVGFEVDDLAGTSRSMADAAGPSLRRRRRSRGVRRPAASSRRAVLCAKSPRRRTHCASSRTCEPRPRADNNRNLGGVGRGDRGSAFRENRTTVRLSSTGKRQHAEPGAPSRKQFQTVSSIGSLDMPPLGRGQPRITERPR